MQFILAVKNLLKVPMSDEALMLHYSQTGDSKFLSQLYDNCALDLFHFLLGQSNQTLAEDISQKTWLKVIEKREYYRRDGRFKAWLFTLGRNLLLDELRAKHNQMLDIEQIPALITRDNTQTEQEFSRFQACLQQLPFAQKEAFVLQQEGFGLQEIANITHCKVETIKSRIRYAKQHIKQALEQDHE